MSREEFLQSLEARLQVLNEKERDDILSEYRQHISLRMESGLSEEEAIRDFGDFEELVSEILDAYNVNPEFGRVPQEEDRKKENAAKAAVAGAWRLVSRAGRGLGRMVTALWGLMVRMVLGVFAGAGRFGKWMMSGAARLFSGKRHGNRAGDSGLVGERPADGSLLRERMEETMAEPETAALPGVVSIGAGEGLDPAADRTGRNSGIEGGFFAETGNGEPGQTGTGGRTGEGNRKPGLFSRWGRRRRRMDEGEKRRGFFGWLWSGIVGLALFGVRAAGVAFLLIPMGIVDFFGVMFLGCVLVMCLLGYPVWGVTLGTFGGVMCCTALMLLTADILFPGKGREKREKRRLKPAAAVSQGETVPETVSPDGSPAENTGEEETAHGA